nr:hypothetical protein [Rhodococcus sp. (in: high G+C Gram-positive bacteria)]
MSENKTKPTETNAGAWLDAIEHPVRRADGLAVHEMFTRITGEPAVMWGPTMIGYGEYHYRYASGRAGDAQSVRPSWKR